MFVYEKKLQYSMMKKAGTRRIGWAVIHGYWLVLSAFCIRCTILFL